MGAKLTEECLTGICKNCIKFVKNTNVQKYENYIHDFLLQQQEISLERIGSFKQKGDTVEFSYDKKAVTTPAFITYVAEHLHKNAVLVGTNIESHLEQARQFINIGKPYSIPGIGIISITRSGEYGFEPHFSTTSMLDSQEEEYVASEPAERERKKKGIMWLAVILILVVVGAGGYGLYNWLGSGKTEESFAENTNNTDSAEEVPIDSLISKKPDTVQTLTPLAATDTATFHFIIEQTFNPYRAKRRIAQLQTLKININLDSTKIGDSTLYKLYFVKTAAPKDTARMNDSLRNWYSARRVVAERAN
jgi:hypothetical protein